MTDSRILGDKIKHFRKRAGFSQFQLELELGAAPGTISRIEAGKVNPTKETLLKIVDVLKLRSFEAAVLFNLELDELPKIVELTKKISSTLDIEKLVQVVVDEVVYDLGLFGGMFFLCDEETIYVQTLTQTWYTKLVFELLPAPLHTLTTKIKDNPENVIVKTIVERKPIFAQYIKELSKNIIPDWISDFVQKVNGTRAIVLFPLIVSEQVVGVVAFSKDKEENFDLEFNVLKNLADYIAVAVVNALKYKEMKEEINRLKQHG